MGHYVDGCGALRRRDDCANDFPRSKHGCCVGGGYAKLPKSSLADATDEQIAAEQERREHEWTDEGWADWRKARDAEYLRIAKKLDAIEIDGMRPADLDFASRDAMDELIGKCGSPRQNAKEFRRNCNVAWALSVINSVVLALFVCVLLAIALTGCATHTQPDARMWDEARDMIRDGSFTDDPSPMPQWLSNPPRTPGAIDVTGTPVWDAEAGVWRQGGRCIEQPIRHADDVGVWG